MSSILTLTFARSVIILLTPYLNIYFLVWWVSALENLIITAGGGGIAYGIGVGFDSLVHN